MMGGNDGLNTVVPFRDDRSAKARPTIAWPRPTPSDARRRPGTQSLADRRAEPDGRRARSHRPGCRVRRFVAIALAFDRDLGNRVGGRQCAATGLAGALPGSRVRLTSEPLAGVQFANELGRTLASGTGRSKSIGNPRLLLDMAPDSLARGHEAGVALEGHRLPAAGRERARRSEPSTARATKGRGASFNYPDTSFGQSLRWAGDVVGPAARRGSTTSRLGRSMDHDALIRHTQRGARPAQGAVHESWGGDSAPSRPTCSRPASSNGCCC